MEVNGLKIHFFKVIKPVKHFAKFVLFTQRGQHVMQILLIDETVSVLVDHVERLFELLDLRLVEHGEDVGGGPLRPLLGGLSFGPFAGHDGSWVWTCCTDSFHSLEETGPTLHCDHDKPSVCVASMPISI